MFRYHAWWSYSYVHIITEECHFGWMQPRRIQTLTTNIFFYMCPKVKAQIKCSFVTPSGNTVSCASSSMHTARPSPLYTVVGMRKPDGGYRKALMRKPAKERVHLV